MNSGNFAEYTVSQKPEGKYLRNKILCIALYITLALGLLLAGFLLGSGAGSFVVIGCMCFIPVIIIVLNHLLWTRFVKFDHKYVVDSAKIKFSEIYHGGKTEKVVFEKLVSSLSFIAPVTDEYKDKYEGADVYMDFRGTVTSPDSYFILDEADGKKTVIFFEATKKAVKVMSFYNKKNTILSDTLSI
ncbi:MAG: hypothetical protein E7638_04065 [Ruminococcaceae bacterium]|nr:hypothetical protein [Oscillospiraceae bacterium]